MNTPRVMIAGTSSGSGKTTAVCAVLSLLKRRGIDVCAYKCGPDYLDPTFHETVTGVPCTNLDPFFCDADLLDHLLYDNAAERLAVIEGVMGYYDGTGQTGTDNSSYTAAALTKTPVILVVNAKGASASLLAVIEGFLRFVPDSMIVGVMFSRISAANYQNIKQKTADRFGGRVACVGYIPELGKNCIIPSRHLGLVSAGEIEDISKKLGMIADICEKTVDLDLLLKIAKTADALSFKEPLIPKHENVSIAVAKDRAFFFYYRDTLSLFEKMGASIRYFSPLDDEPIPDGCCGLYIGGGYPELYADRLGSNLTSKRSISDAVRSGMPTIAECGGFQYLGKMLCGREMCGVLPHDSFETEKLVRFGYVTLTSNRDGLFGPKGTVLRGHEFHYYDSTDNGCDFTAEKPSGKKWDCAVTNETLYAGYPHLYLYSSIPAADAFYKKCIEYQERKNDNQ